MIKGFILFLSFLTISASLKAQQNITMADVEKLKNMTPAQLEAYKKKMLKDAGEKAKTLADKNNIPINTIALPDMDVKPPIKDIKRLQLLPTQPPSRSQLVSSLQQSAQQIRKGIPAPRLEEIQQVTSTLPVNAINEIAIRDFYADDPKGAILMMMETAARAPDSLLALNNLGAMLNLQSAEHIAIPILQYCLQKIPGSSTVLNNIGQSFMGLGDLMKAAAYFNQCLSIDSLNIEANHSMGMLHYFKKEYDESMKYFEREMSMATRASTLAMAYKMGRKFNLRAIGQRRQRNSGRKQKDHFEEITMGRFSFPHLPPSSKQIMEERNHFNLYSASVQAEQVTWTNYASQLAANSNASGYEHAGLYSELVKAMLEELHEEFTPEYLSVFSESDHEYIQETISNNYRLLNSVECPDIPEGTGNDAIEAYEIKCCREMKQPIADKMVYEIGSFVQPLISKGEGRWKAYINQLVEIVQMDPSPGNKALVYHAVANYFNYLSVSMVSFPLWEVNNMLPKCYSIYNDAELDSLIESDRNWQINCPPWLNMEVDFKGMVVKVDCNKYVIEAGSSLMGGFEHEFKTGKSTLLFGPATKLEFLGLKAEMKNQLYITFDGNKQFADFGIKNSNEIGLSGTPIPIGPRIKIGGNLAGIEVSNSISINGGFNRSVEKKGALAL